MYRSTLGLRVTKKMKTHMTRSSWDMSADDRLVAYICFFSAAFCCHRGVPTCRARVASAVSRQPSAVSALCSDALLSRTRPTE